MYPLDVPHINQKEGSVQVHYFHILVLKCVGSPVREGFHFCYFLFGVRPVTVTVSQLYSISIDSWLMSKSEEFTSNNSCIYEYLGLVNSHLKGIILGETEGMSSHKYFYTQLSLSATCRNIFLNIFPWFFQYCASKQSGFHVVANILYNIGTLLVQRGWHLPPLLVG